MLVIFVTVDGEDLVRKAFRRAKNSIKSDGREWKIKEDIKNSDNSILVFKINFPQEI